MRFQGKIVILSKPEYKEKIKGLQLGAKDLADMDAELIKSYTKLTVYAVGEDVNFCKAGDNVLITPRQLSFSDVVEIDGGAKFVTQESHIIAIYPTTSNIIL